MIVFVLGLRNYVSNLMSVATSPHAKTRGQKNDQKHGGVMGDAVPMCRGSGGDGVHRFLACSGAVWSSWHGTRKVLRRKTLALHEEV